MKRILILGALSLTFFSNTTTEAGFRDMAANDRYILFSMGPMIPTDGYGNLDTRFFLQFDYANDFYALPMNFSFGDDLFILGLKPHLHYWMKLLAQYPKFKFAPSLGGIFNYWTGDSGASDYDAVEFGLQLAAHFRYDFDHDFFIYFSPFSMDINFWRNVWIGNTSNSNSSVKMFYNIAFGAAYKF